MYRQYTPVGNSDGFGVWSLAGRLLTQNALVNHFLQTMNIAVHFYLCSFALSVSLL